MISYFLSGQVVTYKRFSFIPRQYAKRGVCACAAEIIGNLSMRENLALTSAYGKMTLQALVVGGEDTQ